MNVVMRLGDDFSIVRTVRLPDGTPHELEGYIAPVYRSAGDVPIGELELRRARARVAWALDLFVRRYGSFGIERVGGGKSAEALVAATPGSALDAFNALATRAALAS